MNTIENVAILANHQIETWEKFALERLVDKNDVEIPLVVVNDSKEIFENKSPEKTWASQSLKTDLKKGTFGNIKLFFHLLKIEGAWAIVLAQRKVFRIIFGIEQELFKPHDVQSIEALEDSKFIFCEPVPTRTDELINPSIGGSWKDLPDEVVSEINRQADLVIRFGFGLIEGSILNATEHGVLSFHSSDFSKYRGLASTERYLDNATEAGVTLQRLNQDIDGGEVVAFDIVDISDLHLQDEINNRLKERQIIMLSEGFRNLQNPDHEVKVVTELADYTSTRRKTEWLYCFRIVTKELVNAIKKSLWIPR